MSSAASGSEKPGSDRAAITAEGRRAAVQATIDLPDYRDPRSRQVQNLVSLYGALIRRERPLSRLDLQPYFIPAPSSERKQGFYADYSRWWAERGESDLRSLPGIEETEGGLRFVGVERDDLPDDVSDDDLQPLAEFRSDPRVRATVELDDRFGPESDEIEDVLRIYDTIAAAGKTTSEEIGRDYRLDLESYADVLAGLPGIERAVETPPEPEDIPVETYADVLDARREIDSPPTETWRFSPEA